MINQLKYYVLQLGDPNPNRCQGTGDGLVDMLDGRLLAQTLFYSEGLTADLGLPAPAMAHIESAWAKLSSEAPPAPAPSSPPAPPR